MAEQSLKKAPRRQVVDVERTGDWGEIVYKHNLTCGHSEFRKRKSPKTHIACSGCLRASGFEETLRVVQPRIEPIETPPLMPEWTMIEETASAEADIERLRAAVASHLGISPDSVDVVTSQQTSNVEVSYVLAFIEATAAFRILRKTHDS